MMRTIDGVVTIVQEGRFQLTDDGGVSHLFILGPNGPAETEQLAPLQHRQARVRVSFESGQNIIGNVAHDIRVAG